jgi:hypothetical protein
MVETPWSPLGKATLNVIATVFTLMVSQDRTLRHVIGLYNFLAVAWQRAKEL